MKKTKAPESVLPSWNLVDLFSSESDPRIDAIFKKCGRRADAFAKRYRGKLKAEPRSVLVALREFESIQQEAAKPVHYASLLFAESSEAQSRGAFLQRAQSEYMKISQTLLFFELE